MESELKHVAEYADSPYFRDFFKNYPYVEKNEFVQYLNGLGCDRVTWIQFFDTLMEFIGYKRLML